MYIGMTASICSLIYTALLLIVYLKKVKLRNDENAIYGLMLFSNIFGLMFEFLVYLFSLLPNVETSFIPMIVERFYFVYLFTWTYLFANYIYITSYEEIEIDYSLIKSKKYLIFTLIIYVVITFLIFVLPVEHIINGNATYSIGPACNLLYISAIISVVFSIVVVVINRKRISYKKKLPLISLILCLIAILIARIFVPEVLFLSTAISFVTILTFFTIENPDIKMLKELNYSKQVAEKSQKKTMNTLNELQNDLKTSLDKLVSFGNKKIDKVNINNEIEKIQENSIELVDKISIAIDLAKIDSGSYKLNFHEYDTYEFLETIEYYLNYKKSKDITIITEISETLNRVLYGDSEKIQQLIMYLFDYIVNLSKFDIINIKVDSSTMKKICRLKFHFYINDENINKYIDFDERLGIGDIVGKGIDFELIQKLLELLKGKIEIKKINSSPITEILLSIDQKIVDIYDVKTNKEKTYEKKNIKYFDASDKRILIIDDNNLKIKEIVELLKPYNVEISISNNISDLFDSTPEDIKYDLIIIDDIIYDEEELIKEKSVYRLNNMIKINKRFFKNDIPTVIMITKNNIEIEKECLQSGFSDYIIKPMNKIKLNKILLKYLKNDKKDDLMD